MAVGFSPDIERVVPSHIEGQGFHCLRIGQVVQLLQQQGADNDMQILRRSTKAIVEMTTKIVDRKSLEKMATKNTSPGSLQQQPTCLAKKGPVIKQITRPSIAQSKHTSS
jgi:hypothetical protein